MSARRSLAGLVLALLPKIALAQTLTVLPDQPVYLVGETVTLTVTGDSQGAAARAILGSLTYPAELTHSVEATQTPHTYNNGRHSWFPGRLPVGDGHGTVFNQIAGFSPATADQLQIATLTLIAERPGIVAVAFAEDLMFFGLDSAPGTVFTILPNPDLPNPNGPPPSLSSAPSSTTSAAYLVWPSTAKLGETIGVLLDAQAAIDFAPQTGPVEVDAASFEITLTDPSLNSQPAFPRAAIEAPAALGSLLARQNPASWRGIVLVFDLPSTWSGLNPGTDDLLVDVEYEGELIFDGRAVSISAAGGSAMPAGQLASLGLLEQQPMLRFRPSWDGDDGFDPTWEIHGLEFVLRYDRPADGDVANALAIANGDATGALAGAQELVPPANGRRWNVSLAASEGFTVADKGCDATSGDCFAGDWSLVDLTLDKSHTNLQLGDPIFAPGHFTIEDIAVLDANGSQLNPPYAGETYFHIHAVNHLVDPAPAPPASLIAWPPAAYLGDTVAVLFNSEDDVDSDPDAAYLDADTGNVSVTLTSPGPCPVSVAPRAVVELPASLGSKKAGAPPVSQTGKVAFFEIPDPWPNQCAGFSLAGTYAIDVAYDNGATSGSTSVEVLGDGGTPTAFDPVASLEDLTLGHMLRLRPVWNEGASPGEGFDPGWLIGALEFQLRYQQASGSGEVLDLAAVRNGEGVGGLARTLRLPDQGAVKLWNISLTAPAGFQFVDFDPASTALEPVGRWSLLDLLVDADLTGITGVQIFTESEFTVENLRVLDRNGVQLNAPYQGEPFFEMTALPEPHGTLPLFWVVAALLALRARRRPGPRRTRPRTLAPGLPCDPPARRSES